MANRDVLRFPIWPGRLPDNAILWFTDVASDQEFRFTPDQLPAGQRVGVNDRPSLWMQVRCYSIDTPQYEANDATLVDLDQANMCLNTVITVDWGPDGYGRQYRVTFDPAGPLRVYKDGRFIGSPDIPASYVLIGSEAEAAAGVDVYDPEELRVPADAIRLHLIGALTLSFAAAVDLDADDFEDGIIPAPTGNPAADAGIWRQRPVSAPGYIGFQAVTVEAVRYLVSEEQLPIPRDYRLLRYNEQEPGDLTRPTRAAYDVLVRVGTSTRLRPSAVRVDNETGELTEGTYDLATDEFTEGASGGAVPPDLEERLQEIEADVTQAEAELLRVETEHDGRLDNLEAPAVLFRNGQRLFLDSGQLNNDLLAGDTVRIQAPLNTSTLLLKNGVSYATNGIPLGVSLLTDNSQPVQATLTGGSPTDFGRFFSLSNAESRVTLEADLASTGSPGNQVSLANGAQLTHRGLLGGWGSGVNCAYVTESSRYYFTGQAIVGGSRLLLASGTSYAELRLAETALFNFRPLLELSESAECDLYGSTQMQPGNGYVLKNNGRVVDNAVLRVKTGTHTNADNPPFVLGGAAKLYVSSGVTIGSNDAGVSIAGNSGTVYRHAGGIIAGTIAAGITVVELPSDASQSGGGSYTAGAGINIVGNVISATAQPPTGGGAEDPRKECSTANGRRTSNLWREGRAALSDIVLADNAASVAAQVIQNGAATAPSRAGTPAQVAAAITADITALANPALYVVRVITTPTNAANSATVLLSIQPA